MKTREQRIAGAVKRPEMKLGFMTGFYKSCIRLEYPSGFRIEAFTTPEIIQAIRERIENEDGDSTRVALIGQGGITRELDVAKEKILKFCEQEEKKCKG
jgi:hypothetical protein